MTTINNLDFLSLRTVLSMVPLQQRLHLRTMNRKFCEAIDSIPINEVHIRFSSSKPKPLDVGQNEIRLKRYFPIWDVCQLKYIRHLSIEGEVFTLELSHLKFLESLELSHSQVITLRSPLPSVKRLALLDGSVANHLLKKFPNLEVLVVRDMRFPSTNRHEFKLKKYRLI